MARILVVEDESMVRENVLDMLRADGHTTFGARDGEDGVRISRAELPDLIICDINMPNLDGYGVLARLSQDPLTAAIPFIFLTGRVDWGDQRSGMRLGADDYITKPFTQSDLISSVRRRLDKKKSLINLAELRLGELKNKIERGMPYEMMAPLSVLLGHSEALSNAEWVNTDISQVRNTAKEIHSAASRLVRLLQSYTLYNDLESLAADPARRARLIESQTQDCAVVMREMAAAVAFTFNREDDLSLDLDSDNLRVSEMFLQVILDELLNRAFICSKPGSRIQIRGKAQGHGVYSLTVNDLGDRFPMDTLGVTHSHEEVGLLLVQRIIDLVGGGIHQVAGMSGNQVDVELPLFQGIS